MNRAELRRAQPCAALLAAVLASLLASLLVLAGCAGQTTYLEGKELAAAGYTKEALEKFDEATRQDAGSAQYRIAAIQAREALVQQALAAAQKLIAQERSDEARAAYHRALAYQPGNFRALDGLGGLDRADRHGKWLSSAQAALEKEEGGPQARNWLRMLLTEDPQHKKAQAMLQALDAGVQTRSGALALAAPFRTPITMEFKDAPIKTVFEVIARTSGLNFLMDRDVKTDQKTSIFLKNSTTEAAIALTLLSNQLEMRIVDATTVLIYPNTQAKQRDYQPLVVKTFYFAHADAKSVANSLKTILKSKDIVVDERLNMLILRDTPEAVRLAGKLVAVHDVADSEVMLELEVLEVKRTRMQDLGIKWTDQLTLSPIASKAGALTLADLRGLNDSTLGAAISPSTLAAKNVDTDTNILANPRIRVRNREKAKILIGERVPNITSTSSATGFVGESVNYVDVGLKLDVEPTISLDGEVAIKVALEVSSIISQVSTKSGSVAYQIGTRTAQTILRLKDGENQVLAGLINSEERRTGNKVPGLGDIPIAGRLFGQQIDDNTKTEIVLSITPRIVRNLQRPAESTTEFDSGTESNLNSYNPLGSEASKPASSSATSGKTEAPAQANGTEAKNTTNTNTKPAPVPAPDAAVLSLQGPTAAKVGDTIALQFMLQSAQPLVNVPMAVAFDPRVFQVVSVVEGDFLKQGGAPTHFASRVDPSGQILITGTRIADTGATAPGVLATAHLRVVSAPGKPAQIQVLTLAPVALGGVGAGVSANVGASLGAPMPAPWWVDIAP